MKFKTFPSDRQLDIMDCGPACLKIISKYYGKYYSLPFLRDLCGVNKEGASLAGLSHAAEKLGMRTLAAKCSLDELLNKIPLPAIVHWKNSHFIVVYRKNSKNLFSNRKNSKINISDPAKGLISYSKEEFTKGWLDNETNKGVVLILQPQADFHQREIGEKLEQKKTFNSILSYFSPYKTNFLNLFIIMFVVTLLQSSLPFISKAVIDVGIQTNDLDFINIVLIANISIIVCITLCNIIRD